MVLLPSNVRVDFVWKYPHFLGLLRRLSDHRSTDLIDPSGCSLWILQCFELLKPDSWCLRAYSIWLFGRIIYKNFARWSYFTPKQRCLPAYIRLTVCLRPGIFIDYHPFSGRLRCKYLTASQHRTYSQSYVRVGEGGGRNITVARFWLPAI